MFSDYGEDWIIFVKNDDYHIDTLAIHAGQEPDPVTGAIMPPIYQSSTFAQPSGDEFGEYMYSRGANPTRTALEQNIAALEYANYGVAYSSGLAAIDCVLRLLNPGDHIVVGNDVYGGTYRLFEKVHTRYGLEFTWVDQTNIEAVQNALTPKTRLLWIETPSNPYLSLGDIQALSAILPDGVLMGVDNTFASPYAQQPLNLGADIVMHSSTKYLNGHSDVIGGLLAMNDQALYEELKFLQNSNGGIPSPMDCFLVLRGIKTLGIRMERHSQNALQIARMLEDHPAVERVIYPGLESHPQHELATRQMRCFSGMVSIILHNSEQARQMVSRTKLFTLAVSLGGVESLIEYPHNMTHASTADSELAVHKALIRLSVGIENVDDLMNDLKQALMNY